MAKAIGSNITPAEASSPIVIPSCTYGVLMSRYSAWLHMERRLLARELWPELGDLAYRYVPEDEAATLFHFPLDGICPPASSRAAPVLHAVGVL
ncbi:hypothetical protein [Ferrovibrio sp.]|uniref:hypothetical protein n=1 Tax=Ferrovibrio sp. TaxID=1917215 RepID=UPI0031204708